MPGSGAAVGAGVGAAAGGKKGALVGAGVGAAVGATAGALVGRYMDNQEKELRKEVESARVVRAGDKLVVEFNSAILFDTGQATLRPVGQDGPRRVRRRAQALLGDRPGDRGPHRQHGPA